MFIVTVQNYSSFTWGFYICPTTQQSGRRGRSLGWSGKGGEIGNLPVNSKVLFLRPPTLFDISFLFSHCFGIRACSTLLCRHHVSSFRNGRKNLPSFAPLSSVSGARDPCWLQCRDKLLAHVNLSQVTYFWHLNRGLALIFFCVQIPGKH